MDWSRPENLKLAAERLQARYGPKVRLDHVDLSQPGRRPVGVDESDTATPYPRVLIDGRTVIAGDFDLRMLLDVVEAAVEMG